MTEDQLLTIDLSIPALDHDDSEWRDFVRDEMGRPKLNSDEEPIFKPNIMRLIDLARPVLLVDPPEERDPAAKQARYDLWNKLRDPKCDLTISEVAILKGQVEKFCSTLSAGRIKAVLPK